MNEDEILECSSCSPGEEIPSGEISLAQQCEPAPRLQQPDAPGYFQRPEQSFAQELRTFLYNAETGEVLGRTASRWSVCFLFYVCFYSGLIGFCYLCHIGLMSTVSQFEPKYKLEQSLIGSSPGLAFKPTPPNIDYTLIWCKSNDTKDVEYWVGNLNKFLEVYMKSSTEVEEGNYMECNYTSPAPPEGKVCSVDIDSWDPCTSGNNFNYDKGTPCVFIKLNKIYDWEPVFYNDTNSLPKSMPLELKKHIHEINIINESQLNTVWLTCGGLKPYDRENIGPVEYIPRTGFPGYFYPYTNKKGYLSPLVALHFIEPKRYVVINIECKAWAQNIVHEKHDQIGSLIFQIQVD
ncbi:sodium/potassium-transporting ATPase subunit beta-2-like isoform X2 [Periplaneta americana]|uniref:sodium/potassium-transporting ATPase subunit beta-2-like isoform X2 n=1 Tax=Periplaneta americana TaxID=6978 RepID=UPI0037E8B9B9